MEEKKGFLERMKKEIIDHKWLCIMCGAAVLLILTILLIPVNNGRGVLYNIISSNKENKAKDFAIVSVEKKSEGKYIDNNEEFIVTTKNGDLEEVKKHLYLDPPLNYDIEEESKDNYVVKLRDVPRDTLLNINYVTDEIVDYKWAFQSNKDFKVTSVYPTNESSNVSPYTNIEVVLSMAVKDDFANKFSIEPKVEGTFDVVGRVLKFKPNKELAADTTYTIHIEKGYEYNGLVMEEGYTSTFSTYKNSSSEIKSIKYSSITYDRINTFKVGEPPIFKLNSYDNNRQSIGKITISKFKNSNHFLKYLNNEKDYSLEDLGEYKYTTNPLYKNAIILEKGLDKGYYLENVYLNTGELFTSIPVQIHELSAFAFTSDKDLLVWVGSNNKLLKDININYKDKKTQTDQDGIAIIKNYNIKDEKIDYVYVGDKEPLIVGINNKDHETYPYGYLYTDRPLYKNTDTVSIWGYVPISYFEEDFNKDELLLKVDEKAIDYTIDSNGIISSKIEMDNYKDDSYCIELVYKNYDINTRCFEVKNYQNQIYSYTIIRDKNYVNAGQNYEFDIEINHVSGMTVSNKEVIVSYDDKDYRGTTDENGVAHFSIKTKKNPYNNSNISYDSIIVKNSDVLYNEYNDYISFYRIDRLIGVDGENMSKMSDKKIKLNIFNLDGNSNKKRITPEWNGFGYIELKKNNYEGTVQVSIIETDSIKTPAGTRYNAYTKENEPIYNYSSSERVVSSEDVEVKDGVLDYTANFQVKQDDDNNSYSYSYKVYIKDANGETFEASGWFDRDDNYEDRHTKGYVSHHGRQYDEGSEDYVVYRYYLDSQSENKTYSIDDKIDFRLKDYRGENIKEKAKVLQIKYKTKIIDTYLYDNTNEIANKFNKKDEPGMDIAGAYYYDDKFYRLPSDYYDYKKEDSLVDISIKTDKQKYKPRDEVELEINTKDYKGNGLETNLNISVVDESVFNIAEDYTGILDTIQSDHYYFGYLYSSFRDYELFYEEGGQGGTGGPDRYDFGDTILFKNVTTDKNGNVKLKFKLNDSITSFRITVHAVGADNKVGANKKLISSQLPLSISYTEPRGLKTSDDFVLNASILGTSNDKVDVTFEVEGKDKQVISTVSGKTVYANFGKLEVGKHNVRISATSGKNSDAVKFQVPVVLTQEEVAIKTTKKLKDDKKLKIKKNPVTIELYRNGMSKYIYYLDKMNNYERRLDTILSSRQSAYYENKYYGTTNSLINEELGLFQKDNYLKYLPSEETSRILTAIVNYYNPGLFTIKTSNIYEELNNEMIIHDYNTVIEYYLILASMKEPVLDDLKVFAKNMQYGDEEHKALLMLAFAFIGDYNTAKELYTNSELAIDPGLKALIATFVDKDKASEYIDSTLEADAANRYVYFAMMSYFMNNKAELSEQEEVSVRYGDKEKKVVLEGLKIARLKLDEKDLKSLTFITDYEDILVDYYYQGELDKENENVHNNIQMTLNNNSYKVGEYATLKLNISQIPSRKGLLRVYLPNSLRLSGNIKGDAYLISNRTDYLILSLNSEIKSNTIEIPLYVTSPGHYKFDSVVYKENNDYYISNELELNIE